MGAGYYHEKEKGEISMDEEERTNENDDIQNFDGIMSANDGITDDGYTDPDADGSGDDVHYEYAEETTRDFSAFDPIEPPPPDYENDPDESIDESIAASEAFPLPEEKTQDERIEEAVPVKKENPHENKAQFFNRNRAVTAILVVFIFLVLFFVVVLPLIKPAGKKKKTNELEKAGEVYIPSELQEQEAEPETKKEDFSGGNSKTNNDDLENKFPPPIDDIQTKQSPIVAPASTPATVSVPITNQNEQQKALSYVPLDTGGSRNTANQPSPFQRAQGSPSSASYTPAALEQNLQNYFSSLMPGTNNNYVTQNNQSAKQQFANNNASGGGNYRWNSLYSLWKGTVIPAVLETGINTDLPGVVTAKVTQNVYSSQDGRYLLIPQGSKLFATYNSSISYGQNRIQVAWDTLIRPDGLEINLGNVMGVDKKGFSGYSGWVSEHPFEYAKALGFIAMFSLIDTKISNTLANSNNNYVQNMIADTYNETRKLNNKILERALDIQPTLYKLNGSKVNLIINITMDIPPIEPFPSDQKYVRE